MDEKSMRKLLDEISGPTDSIKKVEHVSNDVPKQTFKTSTPPKPKKDVLNKEFNLRVKPKDFLFVGGVVVILVLVFFMGRWSVGDIVEDQNDVSFFNRLSGYFSADPQVEEVVVEENETEEEVVEETPEEVPEPEVEEPEVVEEPEEKEEYIVTNYNKVTLTVTTVGVDWRDTWGKVNKIYYKITNEELGTILPAYFIMTMEGYDDDERKVPLPEPSQIVKSKKILTTVADVPNGFGYRESETGDLTDVLINVMLYDSSDKLIDSYAKTYDLSG